MLQLDLPILKKETLDDTIVNVAQVHHLSPFRYPGGKTWLVPRAIKWIINQKDKPKIFIEPFVGGGIVSLTVAHEGLADKCLIIELDDEIAAVWKTIIYGDAKWLINQILTFKLSIETANEVLGKKPETIEEKGFQTILKNRIYHGGILAPGSGMLKKGENGKGIHSRWYPETIAKRITNILRFKDKLEFLEEDAFDKIQEHLKNRSAMFFIDPPYTASKKKAGSRLYRFHQIDHERLFKLISQSKASYMMTYDDAEEIRTLCDKYNLSYRSIPMKGTHHRKLSELMI